LKKEQIVKSQLYEFASQLREEEKKSWFN